MGTNMDTSLLDRAILFAVQAHKGQERRGHGFPYVVHPLEAVSIVASISSDQELLAAAALHDVVEDCDVSHEDIEREFGPRVAKLVFDESEAPMEGSAEETWKARKQAAIDRLAAASYDSKVVAMGDKLSNMRAIARDYFDKGDEFWKTFHNSNPAEHAWHYRGLAESLSALSDTYAYKEFVTLIDLTFDAACQN